MLLIDNITEALDKGNCVVSIYLGFFQDSWHR